MSLLTRVEGVAEFIITYFFRKPDGNIQPVHVAKELLRAMLKNKQVSISNVYVPNIYKVFVNPTDYAILESFGETFRVELAKHLYDEGRKQGYTFLTLPVVEIKAAEEVSLGCTNIRAEFNDSIVANWEIQEEKGNNKTEELEKTTILVDSVRLTSSLRVHSSRKTRSYLEIIKGNEEGKIFYIDKDEIVVGRHEDCDIEIQDAEISRKHLKIFLENRRWFVQDLGSTNGTYVNKFRVDRYMVHPGDKIKAGQTQFRFNVEK
ncbi:MAG: DUF3662 domain-containing protein [Peptococcaceae bacterium]|nr:DUF3662 domain-containing protein [Peptococcaceae bacterium]